MWSGVVGFGTARLGETRWGGVRLGKVRQGYKIRKWKRKIKRILKKKRGI